MTEEPWKEGRQEQHGPPELRSCVVTEHLPQLYAELERMHSELVTMQRELAKKNVELERLNEQKNQFLGMASHDLRTPLSAIMVYSELLLEEASPVLNDEHVHFLSTIKSSAAYMLGLVNDLLDMSAIEAGQPRLDLKPVDLILLARRVLSLHAIAGEQKQLRLGLSAEQDLPRPFADAGKIEQVLHNLLANAIKFAPARSAVEIRLFGSAGQVILAIRDEGRGIAVSQLSRLFIPFETADTRAVSGERGTGLGLAIARRIIEAHRGRIWVESEVGSGATFYVALPLDARVIDDQRDPDVYQQS